MSASDMNQKECPICMDEINFEKNFVKTECGHCFHSNCLMQNVAHNGFGCPYCRTEMAIKPRKVYIDDEYDSDDDEDEYSEYDQQPVNEDYIFRGLRFLFNNIEGVQNSEEDNINEDIHNGYNPIIPRFMNHAPDLPPIEYIVEKLMEEGFTMMAILKSVLIKDFEENIDVDQFNEFEEAESTLYDAVERIISNYSPPDEDEEEQEEQVQETNTIVEEEEKVDEPMPIPVQEPVNDKRYAMNNNNRRISIHV